MKVKKVSGNGTVEINVRDNGKGLPDDIDPLNADTFGFQLVTLLVRQLKGTLGVVRCGGTSLTIRFQIAKVNEVVEEVK